MQHNQSSYTAEVQQKCIYHRSSMTTDGGRQQQRDGSHSKRETTTVLCPEGKLKLQHLQHCIVQGLGATKWHSIFFQWQCHRSQQRCHFNAILSTLSCALCDEFHFLWCHVMWSLICSVACNFLFTLYSIKWVLVNASEYQSNHYHPQVADRQSTSYQTMMEEQL